MTQGSFHSRLSNSISNDLQGPYRRFSAQGVAEMHATHVWNIALCESLYPALHAFELALRNRIHLVAMRHFDNEDWFDGRLKTQEAEMLNKARYRISQSTERPVTATEVVVTLSLGSVVK